MTLDDQISIDRDHVTRSVCRSIAGVLDEPSVDAERITAEQNLIELGLDSLKLVDLAVALEDDLGIPEFPLQRWADAEASRPEPRFTVGALVTTCVELLQTRDHAR